jgi:GNAT superfamily N-acetyltransferase
VVLVVGLKAKIRPFRKGDAREVYAMLKGTDELHVGGLTYSEKSVQSWYVTRARDLILIAEVKKEIAGFIASKLNDPEAGAAYIDCLIVKPKFREKGIGRQLLEQSISLLKARGTFFVNLHVRADFPRQFIFGRRMISEGNSQCCGCIRKFNSCRPTRVESRNPVFDPPEILRLMNFQV